MNKRFLLPLALGLALGSGLGAEPKVALVGPFPEEKSVEVLSAQMALEAHNAEPGALRLKLAVFNGGASVESSLDAARKAVGDSDVLAVVLHGEAAASPAVIAEFKSAGIAVVSASSWAQPRAIEAGPTWLCPSLPAMAESAAVYARREAKQSQVAVLDNGAPTSTAAVKAFAERFRAMGGKVPYEGSYKGDAAGLDETVKGMTAHWPQMVFYAGDAAAAGRLILAMKAEKKLVNADLVGLPTLFEPEFFNEARLKSLRTRGLFPCPDFPGTGPLTRFIGFAFPKTSPEYKAYVRFAFRRPGRWTSMLFDATSLAARAVRQAMAPVPTPTQVPVVAAAPASATAVAMSGSAEALSPSAAAGPISIPSRERVASALLALDAYRGIRGVVKFNATREPTDAKVMVYYALNKVNKKEMAWREKAYGPPF